MRGWVAGNARSDKSATDFHSKEGEHSASSIADAVLLLQSDDLDPVITSLQPSVLVLGNEYKDNPEIQSTLKQQRKQGGSVQFHAGEVHYATTDLLSSSERDLRMERLSLFEAACKRQGIKKQHLLNESQSGEDSLDRARRYNRGPICCL